MEGRWYYHAPESGVRGCAIGIAENRLGLIKEGFKVMTYEGNMGDEREFDLDSTMTRLDIFLDLLTDSRKRPKEAVLS